MKKLVLATIAAATTCLTVGAYAATPATTSKLGSNGASTYTETIIANNFLDVNGSQAADPSVEWKAYSGTTLCAQSNSSDSIAPASQGGAASLAFVAQANPSTHLIDIKIKKGGSNGTTIENIPTTCSGAITNLQLTIGQVTGYAPIYTPLTSTQDSTISTLAANVGEGLSTGNSYGVITLSNDTQPVVTGGKVTTTGVAQVSTEGPFTQ